MDEQWWQLPGPSGFLRRVAQDLSGGKNVLLALPALVPEGLREALAGQVRRNDLLTWREVPARLGDGGLALLVERLHEQFAPPESPGAILSAATLANAPSFVGMVVWVEGMDQGVWPVWREFISQYQHACNGRAEWSRGLFCVPLAGSLAVEAAPDVALTVRRWRGVVGPLDLSLDLARQMDGRPENPLHRKLRLALALELAGPDAVLARELARLELLTLIEPTETLAQVAARRGWTADGREKPAWEAGMVDDFDGAEWVHAAVEARQGDVAAVRRRVWRAEVGVLYPFLEEQRLRLVPQVRPYLRLPVETSYGTVRDAADLELGQLVHFLHGRKVPQPLWRVLTRLRDMRHELAHLRPVPAECLFAEEILRCATTHFNGSPAGL
jgi:hypothetical protein